MFSLATLLLTVVVVVVHGQEPIGPNYGKKTDPPPNYANNPDDNYDPVFTATEIYYSNEVISCDLGKYPGNVLFLDKDCSIFLYVNDVRLAAEQMKKTLSVPYTGSRAQAYCTGSCRNEWNEKSDLESVRIPVGHVLGSSNGVIYLAAGGGALLLIILVIVLGVCIRRRRRNPTKAPPAKYEPMTVATDTAEKPRSILKSPTPVVKSPTPVLKSPTPARPPAPVFAAPPAAPDGTPPPALPAKQGRPGGNFDMGELQRRLQPSGPPPPMTPPSLSDDEEATSDEDNLTVPESYGAPPMDPPGLYPAYPPKQHSNYPANYRFSEIKTDI